MSLLVDQLVVLGLGYSLVMFALAAIAFAVLTFNLLRSPRQVRRGCDLT
jgi:hypothetical protein